jgi:hypothetical protein
MEKRLNDINNYVDDNILNIIHLLKKKYFNELEDYDYIENIIDFSLLPLRGSLKYINKYDGNLRSGGL